MRYHHQPPPFLSAMYGKLYICMHPVYSRCTLFKMKDNGLAVIQQKYEESTKKTWWEELEYGIADCLYLNINFKPYFDERAGPCVNGLYPTVTIRQIMWSLKMRPLPKERWETTFDRRNI